MDGVGAVLPIDVADEIADRLERRSCRSGRDDEDAVEGDDGVVDEDDAIRRSSRAVDPGERPAVEIRPRGPRELGERFLRVRPRAIVEDFVQDDGPGACGRGR